MKIFSFLTLLSIATVALGALIPTGTMTSNNLIPFPVSVNGTTLSTSISFDANWRWLRVATGTTNCFTGSWDPTYCPDDATCTKSCVLEGISQAEWNATYGVSSPATGALRINYITNNLYGQNVGDRLYVVNAQGTGYQPFYLLGSEFRFTVDVSQLGCGINGALYFVAMNPNNPQAPFGTLYGDAQCPIDLKVVGSQFNVNKTGACAPEIDIWEANAYATQFTPHTCSVNTVAPCSTPQTCGQGAYRNQGLCDMDGGDFNPYRNGNHNFYGPNASFTIDTSQPFTVATQFITASNGSLVRVRRYYEQNGKTIEGFNQTDATIAAQKKAYGEVNVFAAHGGMAGLTTAMKQGMVLVLSLWDDSTANMLWLDSTYGSGAGAVRGPCPTSSGVPSTTRAQYPNAYVKYSAIQIAPLSGVSPTPTPPTPSPPTPACRPCPCPSPTPTPPSPTPSPTKPCVPLWGECGGQSWTGSTTCCQGKCTFSNPWYSQCLLN